MTRQAKKEKTERTLNPRHEDERKSKIVQITPKSKSQENFLDALSQCTLIVGNGSAGTGKTFLAATHAANKMLSVGKHKVIVSRPYVSMGKSAGLLPGTLEEKLAPYLAPILTVLKESLGTTKYNADFGKTIQVQLLEAVRGMDFQNCTVIIDEAQNLTIEEIKSIVTRIGNDCQLILIGDSYQSDLKAGESGLEWLCDIINKYKIEGADVTRFTSKDIVRSGICKKFVEIFDKEGAKR